jgi:hypothetical protein
MKIEERIEKYLLSEKKQTVKIYSKDEKELEKWLESEGLDFVSKKKQGKYTIYTFDNVSSATYAKDFEVG